MTLFICQRHEKFCALITHSSLPPSRSHSLYSPSAISLYTVAISFPTKLCSVKIVRQNADSLGLMMSAADLFPQIRQIVLLPLLIKLLTRFTRKEKEAAAVCVCEKEIEQGSLLLIG